MKAGLHIKETNPAGIPPLPIGASEFDRLMQNFALSFAHLAIAVSGGPDSMALVFCAQRWMDEKKAGGKLLALIVDHGLRPESASEAKNTQSSLAKIGIAAEILGWQHPPVVSRLHEVARKARYRLLCDACRRHGIDHLLFAHQAQDQAETILMRFAKGSGVDGLAGMPAHKIENDVHILRPFLGISRERLAATCTAAGLSFISDPSNNAAKFARGRLRRILPLLAQEGFTIERLNDLGSRAAEVKAALEHARDALLRVGSRFDHGVIHLDLEHLRSAPKAIAERALIRCLKAIHPEDYPPEHASLRRLADALRADTEMPACTLRGCLVSKSENQISIMREYAAIAHAPLIKPGESIVWDQRWQVTLRSDALDNFTIAPLGNPPHERIDALAPGLRRQMPQGRARAVLPSLWLNGALALIPALPAFGYEALAQARPALSWPPASGE